MLSAMILAFASGVHCRRSRPAGITSIGRARPFPLLSKPLSNVVTSPITRYAPDSAGPQHSNLKTFENVGVDYRLPSGDELKRVNGLGGRARDLRGITAG